MKRTYIGALLACGLLIAALSLRWTPQVPPSIKSAMASVVPASRNSQDEVSARTSDPTPADAQESAEIAAKGGLLAKYPKVRRYRKLAKKVLLKSEERGEMESLLSDTEVHGQVKEVLLRTDADSFTEGGLVTRVRLINYLNTAARWDENPQRGHVAEIAMEILASRVPSEITDEVTRKAITADKLELYYVLKKHFPKELQEFRSYPDNAHLQKLMAFAEEKEPSFAWVTQDEQN